VGGPLYPAANLAGSTLRSLVATEGVHGAEKGMGATGADVIPRPWLKLLGVRKGAEPIGIAHTLPRTKPLSFALAAATVGAGPTLEDRRFLLDALGKPRLESQQRYRDSQHQQRDVVRLLHAQRPDTVLP